MIKVEHCDLLTFLADVIVQQNNCLAVKPHGLSKSIADKFPYADVYGQRKSVANSRRNLSRPEDRPEPGTIQLCWPIKYTTGPVNPFFLKLVKPSAQANKEKEAKELNKTKEVKTEVHAPVVACLFAQYEMGKPGAYHKGDTKNEAKNEGEESKSYKDDSENRLGWFKKCLMELLQQIPSVCSRLKKSAEDTLVVAFPYKVGCGLAGGDWKLYKQALETYSEQAAKLSCCSVSTVICVVTA